MSIKEENYKIARKIAENPFFKAELFTKHYAMDFTMDCPSAPFGMPNHFDTFQSERCVSWLNRTVRKWTVDLKELYGSKDPYTFWAVMKINADVRWGEYDGNFISDCYMRLVLNKENKVQYLNWRIDPIAMLTAAGKPMPDFNVEKALEKFDREGFTHYHSIVDLGYKCIVPPEDNSPESIRKRKEIALNQHICGVRRDEYRKIIKTDDCKDHASFLPVQQIEASRRHKDEKVKGLNPVYAWVKKSSPWMYRDPRNRIYETDDEHVYFIEMNNHGPGCFENLCGNNGHYQNQYLVEIKFDDYGCMSEWNEILCGNSVYSSANIDVVSFPYYY